MSALDQIVKGAAPPGTSIPPTTSRASSPHPVVGSIAIAPAARNTGGDETPDPLAYLPSSPPQIYLNLLILEASLRSQYLTLRDRKRQNTFLMLLLIMWNAFFFYVLFWHPREDGNGTGGSISWMLEMVEKAALMGGVVTGIFLWGTRQWQRGVRWPKRFVGVANRGLRTINCKMVVIRGSWWSELMGHLALLLPSSFTSLHGSSYHYIDSSFEKGHHHILRHAGQDDEANAIGEEDLAPGGDSIKLLLLSKPFSPVFRENWETYRTEYWEKENERRSLVLQRLRRLAHQRAKAQRRGWWSRWHASKPGSHGAKEADQDKPHRHLLDKDARLKQPNQRPGAHSRNSSRSSMVSNTDVEERASISRRGSSSSGVNEGRRRPKSSLTAGPALTKMASRSNSSTSTSPLPRQSSGRGRRPHSMVEEPAQGLDR